MKYTIEITISGCSTNCTHCYVDGGIAKNMSFENYKICIEKIKPLLDLLGKEASVTLGNELFCHQKIESILSLNIERIKDNFSYETYFTPTTGIALLSKQNKNEIFSLLRQCGVKGFMLALHGNEKNHNIITKNSTSFKKLFEAAMLIRENGFDTLYNLMVSKKLLFGLESIFARVLKIGGECRLTVPLFVPTERMRMYEKIRANVTDCYEIAKTSGCFGINTSPLIYCCENYTEKAIKEQILNGTLNPNSFTTDSQDWVFINITQELDMYYGNVGAHTRYIGNIGNMSDKEIIEKVLSLKSNYDFSAYFDECFFSELQKRLENLQNPNNKVYPSYMDCIFNIFDNQGVPNILIK